MNWISTPNSPYSPSACAETTSHLPPFVDEENDQEFLNPNKPVSAAACFPGLWVRIPPEGMDVL
jgi:hypothetical protein